MVVLAIIAGSTEKLFSEILKWLWLAHSNNAILKAHAPGLLHQHPNFNCALGILNAFHCALSFEAHFHCTLPLQSLFKCTLHCLLIR